MRTCVLSAAQVAQFERDGFLTGIPVLQATALLRVRTDLAQLILNLDQLEPRLYEVERAYTERPGEVVCHFLGGFRVSASLHELVYNRAITEPCAQLLGVLRLRFFHDQVFVKPPRHKGTVPWHQDYSYWTRTEPACHITLNLMLDDADEESGCVWFVPGSHRWGLLPKLPFDAPVDAIRSHLPPGATWRPVPAPVKAGYATIHHSHTLHGSYGNRSDRWRRACVFNYMGDHVRVADDSVPLLRGVAPIKRGSVVDGEAFPVVLDRSRA
ncbi:MAG: phytanoyl-CoA dioxygenase family protein [Planctomycetota bacterium]|nr:phytanoyl-CoA dioxygenase family protein [Planctomycetota bacterium]MSR37374.1 phytanoyl-CoA dioxygenase family protein [Planctomycetota bacterium]